MLLIKDSTLTLYGTVSAEELPDAPSFSAKGVREALSSHGAGDIVVNLNSPGGFALEGLATYNTLKSHPGRVIISIDAIAASAASLIAMAGDEIVMQSGALIMIHDPRMTSVGTSSDHRKSADNLDTLSKQFKAIYAARTGKSESEIGKLMTAETWFDADAAIAAGFATRKSESREPRVYAAFDYSQYRNAPPLLKSYEGKITMPTVKDDQIEKDDLTAGKPWASRFYMSAGNSGLTIADLNGIVAAAPNHEAARDALIDKMAAKHNVNNPSPFGPREHTVDNPDFHATMVQNVLYARMSGTAPEGAAREMMGMSLLDIGARLLQAHGEEVSWANRDALASKIMMSGEHSRSDFPHLLTASGHRILLDAYKASQSPLRALAKVRSASDFRALSMLRLSEAPALVEKPEGAELTYGSRSEAKEGFSLKTFGRIFALTREALINDDLGAFSDSSRAWGRAAASAEGDLIAALFTANAGAGAALDDGNPLYTTTRLNKAASGGAIGIATLDAARQAMRGVKSIDGKTVLNVVAKHMVVSPAKETEAQQFLAALQAQDPANVNPFAGTMSLHVEPRFSGNAWRLFADPAELATIVVAYLNGTNGPLLAVREGWTTLGIEFRAVLDFGCGLEDWRGTYLNPGN